VSPIIFVVEGGIESPAASGSGTPFSLARALREQGCIVHGVDSEVYGVSRLVLAARTFSFRRATWRARFRLSRAAFEARSRKAARAVHRLVQNFPGAVVLQYGAGCLPLRVGSTPLFLYCDNFTKNTQRNVHSNVAQLSAQDAACAIALESEVYDVACHIFTMSDYIRDEFARQLLLPSAKLTTVHAGFSFDVAILREANLPASRNARRLIFVGRDWIAKGGPKVLRVFRSLRTRFADLTLVVVGPSTLPVELSGEAGVEFYGFLDKSDTAQLQTFQDLLRTATVFVLPTEYDSFGIAALEAMAFALPVVLSGADALSEIVVNGVTGITVDASDENALEAALASLLADSVNAKLMGSRGRARVIENFTWPAVAARIRSVLGPAATA
jgi:glycosyltransferase involved in cell wall biosynthesis